MQIHINGETKDVPENITITALLQHLNVDEATIVVQRNEEILSRTAFADTLVSPADTLELIRFVGGG